MTSKDEEAAVAEAWRVVVMGRCWYAALLLANGQTDEAGLELVAIADRLPLWSTSWT
jgi:hypothetical protein